MADLYRDSELTRCQARFTDSLAKGASAAALRNGMPPLLDSGAAAGAALVHRPGGVAHHNADPLERDVEFFGDDLGDRDIHTLAHVHLAEIGDDIAVRLDAEPAVQPIRAQRRLHRGTGLRAKPPGMPIEMTRAPVPLKRLQRSTENWAIENWVILASPYAAWAARLTARRMAICVPQRHLSPDRPPVSIYG